MGNIPVLAGLTSDERIVVGVILGLVALAVITRWAILIWMRAEDGDEPLPLRILLVVLDRRPGLETYAAQRRSPRLFLIARLCKWAVFVLLPTVLFLVAGWQA